MDRDLELRHLRYFVAVAEELHFGRAAARLHLAQPPLSQQIRKLEEIVGSPLLTRTSRAVSLTPAGQVFLDRARRTLRNVHEDLEEARSIARGDEGSLRVGFIGSGMLTPLPAMLGRYRRLYPRVQLLLSESYTANIAAMLNRGSLDAGFLRDGGPIDGLHVEPIFTEPFVAVLPATHLLAGRSSISPADLRDEPFVYFTPNAGRLAFEKPLSIFERHGFRPQITQEAPQWLTILRLVGAGLGVSVGPACTRHINVPNIVCLNLRGAHVTSNIELAYRDNEDRAVVSTFAAVARKHFTGMPASPKQAKKSRTRPEARS
jgi:DNA-binding transcriptional LysR family regulator